MLTLYFTRDANSSLLGESHVFVICLVIHPLQPPPYMELLFLYTTSQYKSVETKWHEITREKQRMCSDYT